MLILVSSPTHSDSTSFKSKREKSTQGNSPPRSNAKQKRRARRAVRNNPRRNRPMLKRNASANRKKRINVREKRNGQNYPRKIATTDNSKTLSGLHSSASKITQKRPPFLEGNALSSRKELRTTRANGSTFTRLPLPTRKNWPRCARPNPKPLLTQTT